MDNKQKAKHEKVFQKGDFSFPFEACKKMSEMMRTFCSGEGPMADCCSMMKRMMGRGVAEKPTNSEDKL